MNSYLSDPLFVSEYHNEYLKILNYYQNAKRPSCFVKYYNINNLKSTDEEKLKSTYAIYNDTDIKFDIYDLTPTNYILPITNMTTPVPDLDGQMYDAIETLVTYTIKRPRIHDLITFYGPIHSGETFRVSSIRTQVNAVHSENPVNWFELQLEYAPTGDLSNLKIDQEYVYDLSKEIYVKKQDYLNYISNLEKLKNELEKLDPFYQPRLDLYAIDFQYIPIEVNELICFIKEQFNNKYRNLFSHIKKPYGYIDTFEQEYNNIDSLPFKNPKSHFKIYDRKEKIMRNYFYDNSINSNMIDICLSIAYKIYQAYYGNFN